MNENWGFTQACVTLIPLKPNLYVLIMNGNFMPIPSLLTFFIYFLQPKGPFHYPILFFFPDIDLSELTNQDPSQGLLSPYSHWLPHPQPPARHNELLFISCLLRACCLYFSYGSYSALLQLSVNYLMGFTKSETTRRPVLSLLHCPLHQTVPNKWTFSLTE